MHARDHSLPGLLPVGTAVVLRADAKGRDRVFPTGTPAVIVEAPAEPDRRFRVRFSGGDEAMVKRDHFAVLRQHVDVTASPDAGLADRDLSDYVILRCVIGSRAYGLDHAASDTDRRGVYLPPAAMHWSLFGVPEQLEDKQAESCYWEIKKFIGLALKSNPNVLEVLYTPLVEFESDFGRELRAMRARFLSKLVYQTYNGYAMSQFKKLGQAMRNHGSVKWKHAMHLIRLLLSGIDALEHGSVPVQVDERHRERLLELRDGKLPWDEVDAWRLELHRAFERVFDTTTLPDRPDYEAANDLLIRARRSMVQ